jgi:plasmid stabilization system protein ParE
MTVRYTATALVEIEEICSYIAKENERAAAGVAAAIERAITAIAQRPQSAPVVYDGRVRAKLVGRYQYRVFLK